MKSSKHLGVATGLVWVALFLGAGASAQQPAEVEAAATEPQAASVRVDEQVLVRGVRMSEIDFDLPEYVREFIAEVVAVPMGAGYARWHKSVCVGVENLEATAAQYIVDRVSLLAGQVGLDIGEPGCSPDIMIVFASNAKEIAAYMVENQPLFFRPGMGECCMQRGLGALDDFVEADVPVRWWHVSMPVSAMTGERAAMIAGDASDDYPVISVAGPSRIHNGIRDELHHAIVLVDSTKLRGKTWQQIGDYLAVVSLAQIDLKTDPSEFDSILNLFTNGGAYSGLTDWDLSFVQALYEIDLERLPKFQRNQLVSRIAKQERSTYE